MTILNQKKSNADLIFFSCLQGTYIPSFALYGEKGSHNYGTRSNNTTLCVPRVRIEVAKRSFCFQGPSFFNEVQVNIQSVDSIVTFKHRIKEHLRGLY